MRKVMAWLAAACITVVILATLADTAFAITAEYRFSRALLHGSHLDFDPEVTISGFPFTTQAVDGKYQKVGITARGVDLGGGRRGNIRSTLRRVSLPAGQTTISDNDLLRVGELDGSLVIDSVNLGRFLGITDLTVTTPAPSDVAGSGGPGDGLLSASRGVLLTGSVPAADDHALIKVSVNVDLSILDGRLRLIATGLYHGPAEHVSPRLSTSGRERALAAFTRALPALPLPWEITPVTAVTAGSDIVLSGRSQPAAVTPRDFVGPIISRDRAG